MASIPNKHLVFSVEDAAGLAGLSKSQLRYWCERGFFVPSILNKPIVAFGRLYSFRDIVGLKVIARLRHDLPLTELRRVKPFLEEHSSTPWANLKLSVRGKELVFADPATGVLVSTKPHGQGVINFTEIIKEITAGTVKLNQRSSAKIGRITRNRLIMGNAWRIDGTRIPTATIWEYAQAGYDSAYIKDGFPRLTEEDIKAAVAFENKQRAA